jgi:hypothetical protein
MFWVVITVHEKNTFEIIPLYRLPNQCKEQYLYANNEKSYAFQNTESLICLHVLRSVSFSAFLSQMFSELYLKVLSRQIGST